MHDVIGAYHRTHDELWTIKMDNLFLKCFNFVLIDNIDNEVTCFLIPSYGCL